MSKIFPAATLVLLRHHNGCIETLIVERSNRVSFGKGAWVFPGGRIDQSDYGNNIDDVSAAAKVAAIRETNEETGLTVSENQLSYFSHWTTPEGNHKRYATWYFITEYIADEPVLVDGDEIIDYRWVQPQHILDDCQNGDIYLMLPTRITLMELNELHHQTPKKMIARLSQHKDYPKLSKSDVGYAVIYNGEECYQGARYGTQKANSATEQKIIKLEETWRPIDEGMASIDT